MGTLVETSLPTTAPSAIEGTPAPTISLTEPFHNRNADEDFHRTDGGIAFIVIGSVIFSVVMAYLITKQNCQIRQQENETGFKNTAPSAVSNKEKEFPNGLPLS